MISFDYVHALGCDCNSDNSGSYADRLARIRHEKVEQTGWTWADVCNQIPDGSCIAWMNEECADRGWPTDHRDYHLLQMWESAVAAQGTEAKWPLWDALAEAISLSSWGPQADGSFVTSHATAIGSGGRVYTLHAPGKRGPLAEVVDRYGRTPALRILRTKEEAWVIRLAERARHREAAAIYEAHRQEAGRSLDAGHMLEYTRGEKGGTVLLPSGAGVSARGALLAYGYSREVAEERLYAPQLTTEDGCDCGSGGDAPPNHSDRCIAQDRWNYPAQKGYVIALDAGGLHLMTRADFEQRLLR